MRLFQMGFAVAALGLSLNFAAVAQNPERTQAFKPTHECPERGSVMGPLGHECPENR